MLTGNQLLDSLQPLYTTRIYGTAMYTLVLWEWIVTFPDEVKHIWKADWSVVKVAFLFCRYWTILAQAVGIALWDGNWSPETCHRIYRLGPALGLWTITIGSFILFIRCYAIWEKSKLILYPGLLGLCAVIGVQYYAVSTASQLELPPIIPKFACVATGHEGGTKTLLGMFAGPMCFDFVITVLTSIRVIQYYRRGADTPLLVLFWRDGLFYFVLICIFNLLNVAFLVGEKNPVDQPVNVFFAHLITPILAQRLVLRLRVQGMQSSSVGAYTGPHTPAGTPKYPPQYSGGNGTYSANSGKYTTDFGGGTTHGTISTISPPASNKFGYPDTGARGPAQPPSALPPFQGNAFQQSRSFGSSGYGASSGTYGQSSYGSGGRRSGPEGSMEMGYSAYGEKSPQSPQDGYR